MCRQMLTDRDEYSNEPSRRWFDPCKAKAWTEDVKWNGHNHIGRVTRDQWTRQTLYRTAGGAWIKGAVSQWQGVEDTYELITPADAAAWLIANGDDVPEELAQHEDAAEVR